MHTFFHIFLFEVNALMIWTWNRKKRHFTFRLNIYLYQSNGFYIMICLFAYRKVFLHILYFVQETCLLYIFSFCLFAINAWMKWSLNRSINTLQLKIVYVIPSMWWVSYNDLLLLTQHGASSFTAFGFWSPWSFFHFHFLLCFGIPHHSGFLYRLSNCQ